MDGSQPEVMWLRTSEHNTGPECPLALSVDKARSLSMSGGASRLLEGRGTQGSLGSPIASFVLCQPKSRLMLMDASVAVSSWKVGSAPKPRMATARSHSRYRQHPSMISFREVPVLANRT